MNERMCVTWFLLAATLVLPGRAAGQSSDPGPRVSVGAGAGVAFPFHGDFDFTPWAWEADVRLAVARHVLFEVAVGEWRHSESSVTLDISTSVPQGRIGRLEQKATRVQRSSQFNVLFRGAAGRVRFTAGGGAGVV